MIRMKVDYAVVCAALLGKAPEGLFVVDDAGELRVQFDELRVEHARLTLLFKGTVVGRMDYSIGPSGALTVTGIAGTTGISVDVS